MPRYSLAEFEALPYPILDVRAPIEFAQGHVPGAINLPLFSDEERARIGTTYKQISQERAVHLGLEFFGPNMSAMIKKAQKLAPRKEVRLHCWRGGMRSGSVLWLLELAGFKVHLLDKGYKLTLDVVGGAGTPEQEEYFMEIKEVTIKLGLGAIVTFHGPKAHSETVRFFHDAHIFVSTAVTFSSFLSRL